MIMGTKLNIFLLTPIHLKCAAIIPLFLLFTTVPSIIKFPSLCILMLWLAYYLLHDLFTERSFLQTRFSFFLFLFLLFAMISIVVNIFRFGLTHDSFDPILIFSLFICFAVVPDKVDSIAKLDKNVYSFNMAIVLIAILPFFIAAIFYLFRLFTWVPLILSKTIFINSEPANLFWAERYFTFFGNPNEGAYITILSGTASTMNIHYLYKNKIKAPFMNTLYYVSFFAAFVCFIAFASQTGIVVVCSGVAIALFVYLMGNPRFISHMTKLNKVAIKPISAIAASICAAVMSLIIIISFTVGLAEFSSYAKFYRNIPFLPSPRYLVEGNNYLVEYKDPESKHEIEIIMQREYMSEGNITAGRKEIWKAYFSTIKYYFLLGVSPVHAPQYFNIYSVTHPEQSEALKKLILANDGDGAMTTHNAYLYVLAFYGIFSLISLCMFMAIMCFYVFNFVAKSANKQFDLGRISIAVFFVSGVLVWGLAGDVIISRLCPYSFAAWIYIGYLLHPQLNKTTGFDWSTQSVFNWLFQRLGWKVRI